MENIKLGLVVAEFNEKITSVMLTEALQHAKKVGCTITFVCKVPGSFDTPLMVKSLLEKKEVDAVATLGAILKGDTLHDEVIANVLSEKLAELSLRYDKPVSLGISGPGMTWDQGSKRAKEYSRRAIEAAMKMTTRTQAVKDIRPKKYPVLIK
ncbi:MAG: 6,7-dimethyl-8-ribityllumazine synthase [Nitrososphaerales archaeon]